MVACVTQVVAVTVSSRRSLARAPSTRSQYQRKCQSRDGAADGIPHAAATAADDDVPHAAAAAADVHRAAAAAADVHRAAAADADDPQKSPKLVCLPVTRLWL